MHRQIAGRHAITYTSSPRCLFMNIFYFQANKLAILSFHEVLVKSVRVENPLYIWTQIIGSIEVGTNKNSAVKPVYCPLVNYASLELCPRS